MIRPLHNACFSALTPIGILTYHTFHWPVDRIGRSRAMVKVVNKAVSFDEQGLNKWPILLPSNENCPSSPSCASKRNHLKIKIPMGNRWQSTCALAKELNKCKRIKHSFKCTNEHVFSLLQATSS